MLGIIEIGSNNTKTHIYDNESLVYENNTTIEFKKNYKNEGKISSSDLDKLNQVLESALEYTHDIHLYGCSIFRNLSDEELKEINHDLKEKYGVEIEVISQEKEAEYTAIGAYSNIDYNDKICVFIGGGGSIELIFVENKEVVNKKYYNFGVVDVTTEFPSLKDDVPTVDFDTVYERINELIGGIEDDAKVLILAGGDHLYWYNNAEYKLLDNNLYDEKNQKYMITKDMSDEYDHDALVTSLDRIRSNSDNPLWFDGSRAMKVITNYISNEIHADYIIPTKINMEDGLKNTLM